MRKRLHVSLRLTQLSLKSSEMSKSERICSFHNRKYEFVSLPLSTCLHFYLKTVRSTGDPVTTCKYLSNGRHTVFACNSDSSSNSHLPQAFPEQLTEPASPEGRPKRVTTKSYCPVFQRWTIPTLPLCTWKNRIVATSHEPRHSRVNPEAPL